ncbi:MAG TPA: hypothetical protein VLX92_31160 [Kofleriaceae bacterium]|nr:hypothetical protein [Kofleriaceae bacterium]
MSKISDLDALADAALIDRTRMPGVVSESQRLMHDSDAEVRSAAVGIAFFAVRQVLPGLSPAERVALCDAVAIDLEAAIAAGVVGPRKMLGNVLRGVLRKVRESDGQLE